MTNQAEIRHCHTLVIGSGAAGLAAAVRLHAAGVTDLAIYTEGLKMGTSINTGSDKQTYYKLGMYGREPDSPFLMAEDLMRGGAVHGDIALAEAALSPLAFHHLVSLGVPFPHDSYGQYIGYKTDHDPRRRATSCGPYTSRDMCLALTAEVRRRKIPVFERHTAVKLLTSTDPDGGRRCTGAVFTSPENPAFFTAVTAENVILAAGGPGGFYARSVYPAVHTGAIGLAIEAGAKTRNLPEFQFGMASVKFRWNVSGSYMQVLPRFISTDADGISGEREFLREYFSSAAEMYDMIFLKGYQWPFAAGHVPGSSLIDILVDREITERGRRVFLDYRRDPADFSFAGLQQETKEYLQRSGATGDSPLKRLEQMNSPAVEHYRLHGIDLTAEPLEIAVCAQHNNGGLAGTAWWESENLRGLFPVGEINGSHGITRPGGSALNAGQAGAFRAAEYIAATRGESLQDFTDSAELALHALNREQEQQATLDWRHERNVFQQRMSRFAAFLREESGIAQALSETRSQLEKLKSDGLGGLSSADLTEALRNRQILTAQLLYLESMQKQIADGIGSRGGALILTDKDGGELLHPALPRRIQPENTDYRKFTLTGFLDESMQAHFTWEPCRPLPDSAADGWFENVWRDCREKRIYTTEENH